MPQIKIITTHSIRQTTIIDWPEDEMDEFNYENALCNADFDDAKIVDVVDSEIDKVFVDGEPHRF